MRILGHMYHLGWGWGGGVVTMVLTLDALRERGHSVGLMLQRGNLESTRSHGARQFGIKDVYSAPLPAAKRRRYHEADFVITQGEATPEALALCRAYSKPLAHLIHDEGQLDHYKAKPSQVQLAIYNAQWVQDAAEKKGRTDNAMVVYPIVEPADYRVERTGDAIVLVNICEEKGGKVFWELARRMPEHKFLGVHGGWGGQIVPKPLPPNAEVMEHCLDPREIYRKARIILMPSQDLGTPGTKHWTESYGRIGIEAAASGIPTIAHPTPGLVESLGDAGIFCDRYEQSQWMEAIRELDDEEAYAEASAAALKRSGELEPTSQVAALEAELERICAEWRAEERYIDRPGDAAVGAIKEDGPVIVRALRRLAGRARRGDVIELPPAIAKDLLRRGLVEVVEDDTPRGLEPAETQERDPQETQESGGPEEQKQGVTMRYRIDGGPSFPTREEAEEHHLATAGKVD